MGISLSSFIKNLEEIRDVGITQIAEKEIKDIFYTVLYEMAEKTITDTGQSRSAIIDDFASQNGYPVDEYSSYGADSVGNYWGFVYQHYPYTGLALRGLPPHQW